MEIKNIDIEIVKSKANNKISDNPYAPKHPFRMLVIGPSGCGKSNVVVNLLIEYLNFDRIYVYARDLEEDKYKMLMEFFELMDEKINKKLTKRGRAAQDSDMWTTATFTQVSSDEDIIDTNSLNPDNRNLVVFDDLVSLGRKNQHKVVDLFIRGRKRNCSLIYISQTFFEIPKSIRLQANYVILFQINDARELQELRKTLATRVSTQDFRDMYAEIVNTPYQFMFIDSCAKDVENHIRMGFDKCMISKSRPKSKFGRHKTPVAKFNNSSESSES
jgi:hypothetical protein